MTWQSDHHLTLVTFKGPAVSREHIWLQEFGQTIRTHDNPETRQYWELEGSLSCIARPCPRAAAQPRALPSSALVPAYPHEAMLSPQHLEFSSV